jgi:tripeptide aminopeptidase
MSSVVERFLRYVRIDTQADEHSGTCPSTKKQLDLARLLESELKELKLEAISLDQNGYVMATLPANKPGKIPAIGFIAHMDTSPDSPGADVQPRIWENFDGKPLILNKAENLSLNTEDFPDLKKYLNQTLITSDGTTLLGGDDKAGIAEIMAAIEFLQQHPEIKHGPIKFGFTPDEEIGRGVDKFDVQKFGAEFAYTLDGGEIGELECDTFNAATAKVKIHGKQVHPGYAKNIMKNAMLIGMELQSMLPENERPEFTALKEGFFHLNEMQGTVETTSMTYLIRDHDRSKFAHKKNLMVEAGNYLNEKYGVGTVQIDLADLYYNLREKIDPVYFIVDIAEKAMKLAGVQPKLTAVRGGTDGSRLSFMGLPTPNIFAGAHNFHSRYEFIPVESMEKAVEVIVKIVELFAETPR